MALAKEVLYVEDDTIDQLAFKRIISKDPRIHFTLANTVEEFAGLLAHKKIDLVVTDYYLHDGTAHEVLDLSKGIPSIVVSGTIKTEEKEIIKEKGAIYYLGKPLLPTTFLPLIQELIFGSTASQSALPSPSTSPIDVHFLKAFSSKGPESEIFLTEVILQDIPQMLKHLELGLENQSWRDIKVVLDTLHPKLRTIGFAALADNALKLSQSNDLGKEGEELKNFANQLAQTARAALHIFPQL